MKALSTILCAVCTALLIGNALPARAQPAQPSLPQQGAAAMMYGRCLTDVLTPARRRTAAALAALAPEVVDRLLPAPDELQTLVQMCSQQLHQQRCTMRFLAVAGDILTAGRPGSNAVPPQPDPMAVAGGITGGLLGVIVGSGRDGSGGLLTGAAGAWAGSKALPSLVGSARLGACAHARLQLDDASQALNGRLRDFSARGVRQLIDESLQRGELGGAEAAALIAEADRLAASAEALWRVMR